MQDLRYGENPHQRAGASTATRPGRRAVGHDARASCREGASFNNLVDANAALELVKEFRFPAAVAISHMNPCGVAIAAGAGRTPSPKARASDPVSIFGGIVAVNRILDRATAEAMQDLFLEVVIAPRIAPAALEVFQTLEEARAGAPAARSTWTRRSTSSTPRARRGAGPPAGAAT